MLSAAIRGGGAGGVVLNTLADVLVAMGAATLRGAFLGRTRRLQRCREVSGALFIALGCSMLFGRRAAS